MAETLQFDLVAPERLLASVAATEVQIPGAEGDLTAMPDHAPTITNLRPGVLSVVSDAGTTRYLVTGGFAEITATGTSVLAEQAVPAEEVTAEMLRDMAAEATTARDAALPEQVDALSKQLADIEMIGAELGISL